MAWRMAVREATTGSTWRFVMKATSSMAETLVGSAMARVSTVSVAGRGRTSCLVAMATGTRAEHVGLEVELGQGHRGDAVLAAEERR